MQRIVSTIKLATAVGTIVYSVCLLLMLVKKDEGEAHDALSAIDGSLASPVPAVNLASECGLSNLKVALYDVHVFTHFLGWFITTLATRDVVFCWISGTVWEIIEASFEHSVPELQECWWDKVFMDLLGCNNIGIFLGWLTIRYFKLEEYNWTSIVTPHGKPLNNFSLLNFLTGRHNIQRNYYGIMQEAGALMLFIYAQVIVIMIQLNLFLLKTILWIPTVHWISIWRSFLAVFLFLGSTEPVYKRRELRGFPLLFHTMLALEGLLVLRFGSSLLFLGRFHTLATILMILSIFMLVGLSLMGFARLVKTSVSGLVSPSCCKDEKMKIK